MPGIDDLYQGRPPQPVMTDEDARRVSRVEELAYDLKTVDVMRSNVITIAPSMAMAEVLDLLRQKRISGAPVVEGRQLVGIVSMEDLVRCILANDIQAPAEKYMTSPVISINGSDPLIEAIKTFTRAGIGRLPVVDEHNNLIGLVTKGDITRGVLNSLEKDYQVEEVRRYRASHLFEDIVSDRTSLILRYHIKVGDFAHGGQASSNIKRALLRLGANPQIARRCGIAIYEAEMNLIIHTTRGGIVRVEIEPHAISMDAVDDGPGIADINLAMQAGFSTAADSVREMGFGAGMGLVNIQRCVDKLRLDSSLEKGTRLSMKIYLKDKESFREALPANPETQT